MKLFLDSMVYLHYRAIEEIDLCALFGTDSLTIVLPRIVVRELDKHKSTHPSSRIRDRARRILKKIEQWTAGTAQIRKNVAFEFCPAVPTTGYEQNGLNPQWSDDVLVATVIEYASKHPGEKILLVTQDSGPRLTAAQLGITAVELSEELKLKDEPDPLETENRELSKLVEKLQNALPQLVMTFAGADDPETHARFSLPPPPAMMEAEIEAKIADLRGKLPKQELPKAAKPAAQTSHDPLAALRQRYVETVSIDPIQPEEYQRYNRDVDHYLAAYERYMRETWEQKAALQRTIRFQLEIRNTGTAPADDVDVEVHFPDGFTLVDEEGLPELPKEPRPPRKPRTRAQMIMDGIGPIPHLQLPSPAAADFKMPTSFNIRRTGSYLVSDHFTRIKHGGAAKLPEMFLVFDSYKDAHSFHCEYTIRPANLPDAVSGTLHFVIEDQDANQAIEAIGDPGPPQPHG